MPNGNAKTIYQDGKKYSFTPGKNGSLTAAAPDSMTTLPEPQRGQAKIIGPALAARLQNQPKVTPEQYAMRRKRSNIAQTLAVRD